MTRAELNALIERSRDQVRTLKRVSPQMFPAWAAYQQAKRDLELAKLRLKAAKKAWDET